MRSAGTVLYVPSSARCWLSNNVNHSLHDRFRLGFDPVVSTYMGCTIANSPSRVPVVERTTPSKGRRPSLPTDLACYTSGYLGQVHTCMLHTQPCARYLVEDIFQNIVPDPASAKVRACERTCQSLVWATVMTANTWRAWLEGQRGALCTALARTLAGGLESDQHMPHVACAPQVFKAHGPVRCLQDQGQKRRMAC